MGRKRRWPIAKIPATPHPPDQNVDKVKKSVQQR